MRNAKNNRGFSLVELIIVIAIIVALVAVIAPQYIKYIKRSNEAVLANAAEDVLTAVRTEYGIGNMTGVGDVTVKRGDDGKLSVTLGEGLEYHSYSGETFVQMCGIDTGKIIQSDKVYTIKVRPKDGGIHIYKPEDASFEMDVDEDNG